MPKKAPRHAEHAVCDIDMDALHTSLGSSDAATRAKAVRSICPCRLGWKHFEDVWVLLEHRKKDPDPTVRANALHVFQDAAEMESNKTPTTPRMMTNNMAATKFRLRGLIGDEALRREEKANRKARDCERRRSHKSESSLGACNSDLDQCLLLLGEKRFDLQTGLDVGTVVRAALGEIGGKIFVGVALTGWQT